MFVFQKEGTLQSQIINWPIPEGLQAFNLRNILDHAIGQEVKKLSIFDADKNVYVAFE